MPVEIDNLLQGLPWNQIFTNLWALVVSWWGKLSAQGMYEVLEYESTLELKDKKGRHAIFQKREKVRYLQDNIIAYQDQAWGDGEILLDYRCSPGIAVDRHRPGQTTYTLISLRELKKRGEVDEFNIQWELKNSFLRAQEVWETGVSHPSQSLKIRVIFPKRRPPLKAAMTEDTRRLPQPIEVANLCQLPDGRWQVKWETEKPKLHERYILKWKW